MSGPELSDERVELRQYFAVIRRQRWIIIGITTLSILIALTYALLAPAVYASTAEVLVHPQSGGSTGGAPQPPSMDTEREILLSESVARLAAERLGWTGSIPDLLERVGVDIPPETLVLDVSFSAEDPRTAARGAEAFALAYLEFRADQAGRTFNALELTQREKQTALQEQLAQVDRELERLPPDSVRYATAQNRRDLILADLASVRRSIESLTASNIIAGEIIAHAPIPRAPASPNLKFSTAMGLFVGLFLGVVLGFVRDASQEHLTGRTQAEEALGAPVLSVVPRLTRWRRRDTGLVTVHASRSTVAQAYRILGSSLIRAHGRGGRTFLVTGTANPDTAPSVAANLAVVLAQGGHRVGMVGAPLEPPLKRLFGASPNGDNGDGQQAGLERTKVRGVWLFRPAPRGLGDDLSHPVQARDALDRILDVVDFVVVHAGPLLTSPEAIALTPAVDGVVVAADGRRTRRRALRRLRATVERVGGKLLGGVITGLRPTEAESFDEVGDLRPLAEGSSRALPASSQIPG